ncbi:MAG: Flp family type IVb pilin [Chloroflexota bacterium]
MLSRFCLVRSNWTTQVQKGQGLAEYGLLLVLISVVCVAILGTVGETVNGLYSHFAAVFPR